MIENLIGKLAAIVRDNHFLKQAPENLPHSVYRLIVLKGFLFKKLREQMRSPFNGPCHQLRKEAHIGRKSDHVLAGLQLLSVHINRIAKGLEGIKTNPHRQHDIQRTRMKVLPEKGKSRNKIVEEEIIVFEKTRAARDSRSDSPRGVPFGSPAFPPRPVFSQPYNPPVC